MRNATILVVAAFVGLHALGSLGRIIATVAPDFSVLYQSAQNLVSGKNIYEDATLFTGVGYPPGTLIPFIPLSLLPYPIAQAIWIVGSFLAFIGSVVLCWLWIPRRSPWILMIFLVAGYVAFPTRFTFGMGQANFYALFLLLLATRIAKTRVFLAGILLGMALVMKPHLMPVVFMFLFSRRYHVVGIGMALFFLIHIGSLVVFGLENIQSYISVVVPTLTAFRGRDIYYNQGIAAAASRLLPLSLAFWATTVAIIGVIALTVRATLKKQSLEVRIAKVLPLILLIEPLSWQHHYVFLLPTFVLLWRVCGGRSGTALLFWLSYVLISANIKTPGTVAALPGSGIVLSHVFWGNLVVWFLAQRYL